MFNSRVITAVVVPTVAALLVLGCRSGAGAVGCEPREEPLSVVTEVDDIMTTEIEQDPFAGIEAEAVMKPTDGNKASGRVRFRATDDGVEVRIELAGLKPNSKHGFHIHEKGDCSAPDATSAGGHYAPNRNPHGLPPADKRHGGDMGNVAADDTGRVDLTETFRNFALTGDESVIGRAVILHAEPDVGAQPTGAAGARIACGVIKASRPSKSP